MSLIPASGSKQIVHPNLLHLTLMKQRRVAYKSKLISPSEWRLVLLIKVSLIAINIFNDINNYVLKIAGQQQNISRSE